jgi:dipeptidyl aminopeptidase/acylaminoacyl peptidase
LGSFEIEKEAQTIMTRSFLRKIQVIWFLFLIGCANQNAVSATQQSSNGPASSIQYRLTVTPTQINHQAEKTPIPSTNTVLSNPTPNEKFLILNQGDYYLSALDSSSPTLLYAGKDSPAAMASLSPDQTKFAYFKDNYVYIEDIKTQKTITLNKEIIGSSGLSLKWSPDGTKLFMSCAYSQQPSMSVCAIDTSNGQIEVLVNEKNTEEICNTTGPFSIQLQDISADGSKLIYSCIIISAQGQRTPFALYTYNTTAKTSTRILDSQTQNTIWQFGTARISPDGNYLLINSGEEKRDDLGFLIINVYLMDLKTGTIKQLTGDRHYSFTATTWGSDSKSFYVNKTSSQPYTEENFLMEINGTIISPVEIQGIITQ